jgi:hypothetical protein
MAREFGNPNYDFGYEAYCNGVSRDENPKIINSQAYDDWERGWDCADCDIDDEID